MPFAQHLCNEKKYDQLNRKGPSHISVGNIEATVERQPSVSQFILKDLIILFIFCCFSLVSSETPDFMEIVFRLGTQRFSLIVFIVFFFGFRPSFAFQKSIWEILKRNTSSVLSMGQSSYMEAISQATSEALGRNVAMKPASGGGASGGGGATTTAVADQDGTRYFVKAAVNGHDMLRAEYLGVKSMSDTNTIRVPKPICLGEYQSKAFCVFEYLEFCGGNKQYQLGQQLARMHRQASENSQFGFDIDNTIGATPQPNGWISDWAEFWDAHRLGHMLKLTDNAGFSKEEVKKLRQKTKELLGHNPSPSLVHGDLWGGNKGFCKDNGDIVPVIFDPATYYGDREVDIAMTYVFGGFSNEFYDGYESEWPLPAGHEKRRTIYNLYHILNHEVLFGGMYRSQARGMIHEILRM